MKDPSIDTEWQHMSFILQLSARANAEFLAKAQSASRNAKLMAETSSWNVFKAELETDQVFHKTQISLQTSEVAKRKTVLVETLSSFHDTAWRMVQELCEHSFPTWAILTRDLGERLPAKLAPFLDQARPCVKYCVPCNRLVALCQWVVNHTYTRLLILSHGPRSIG